MRLRARHRVVMLLAGRPGAVVALLAIAVLCGIFLASAYRSRVDALDKAAHQVNITADALEVHARALFSAQTVAMDVLAHEFSRPDWTAGERSSRISALLRRVATGLSHVSNVVLIDRDGLVRDAAWDAPEGPVNLGDRPYFRTHRDVKSLEVRVGPPTVLGLGHGTVFTVTRRLETPDGAFNGILLIAVRPQVFVDFFRTLDIGGAGYLGMLAEDGVILAREPYLDQAIGARLDVAQLFPRPQARGGRDSALLTSPVDKVTRVVALRSLPDLKLMVLAGIGLDDALAEWRGRLQSDAVLALPMLLVLVAVLAGLVAQTRALEASEAAAVDARDALTNERQLFIGGPVVVVKWRATEGWAVEYVSPNVEQHWGYSAEALCDRPASYATLLDPADVERVLHEITQLTAAGRPYFEQEYRIHRADGVVRWVYDFTIVSRNADGSAASYLGYLLDITERKEMERQIEGERDFIRTVINSLPGVFYVIDPDGRFELVNDSFSRITGYSAEEILRRGPAGLLRSEDAGALMAAVHRVFESGSAEVEVVLVTSEGRELPYYFTGVRFDSPAGRRLVGMGLDVSARKCMEEDIRKSNQDLESFAYIASHDLQEPLRTVTTFVQLLKREYGSAMPVEAVEYMEFAVDGALRMSHLIRDLLQYSRAGRSRVSTDAVCRLQDAFDAAVALLTGAIADSGAQVSAGPLPTVRGDTDQLTRLFQNLIGNALKYRHKQRPPEVRVTAEVSGGWVTVAVADNGIGIDPEYHHKIFQVFQRLHARSDYEGTGIGLAICDKIVSAHGGRIWVESVPGSGATFAFTLPAAG
jgi:PAS domain S-box-containing protein